MGKGAGVKPPRRVEDRVQDQVDFDVAGAIEGRKLGGFTVRLVFISWLVTFFDGFDMNVIAFTLKPLSAAFHLNLLALNNVNTIGIVGALLGGFLFGYIGDWIGRRPAIIIATACFSGLTLLLAFAGSYPALLGLRFLSGLALGGAIPLVWALNTEFAPKRFRATAVTLIMLGYGFGVAVAGPIARLLLPHFGWSSVFLFGGGVSFIAVLLLILSLPESLRYLTTKSRRPQTVLKTLARMGVVVPEPSVAGTPIRFVLTDEAAVRRDSFRVSMLFQGELRLLTPLLWAAYIASSMSTFFLTSWGPLVLENMGFGANGAAWIASMNSICGAVGGLAVMRFTDRLGPLSIAVMPIVAVPLLLIAGLTPMSLTIFFFLSIAISIFLGGSHYAITSIVGLFYPSAIRANGAGWASAMAKVGSVLGPLIGGFVLAAHVPVKATYALLAVCPACYGACIVVIGLIARNHVSLRGSDADAVAALAE